MTYFMALIIALSALFNTPTQAPVEAPSQALSQAPITAPSQALTYEAPEVGTVPAPQVVRPFVQAPVQAPSQAPICEEDMPCWDCTTMGNLICGKGAPQAPVAPVAPAQAPVQAPVASCPAPTLMAEDGSCVNPHFYDDTVQAPSAPCVAPTLMAEDGSCVNPNFWDDAAVTEVTLEDAMVTLDEAAIVNPTTEPMELDYVCTVPGVPTELPEGQFALSSLDLQDTSHVYQWTTLTNA